MDRVVGTVSSADWGHRVGKNLAMAFVEPDSAAVDDLHVEVIGKPVLATRVDPCLYDPENRLVKG